MRITALLLLIASSTYPMVPVEKRPDVRVYVYTSTSASGQHTEEVTGRLAAVQDMRNALRKKSGIALVEERSQADVVVEVVGREQRESPSGGFGGKMITSLGDTIIRVHVTSGEEQADLKGIGRGTWGRAAQDAADRVMKWIARREPRKTATENTDPLSHGRISSRGSAGSRGITRIASTGVCC